MDGKDNRQISSGGGAADKKHYNYNIYSRMMVIGEKWALGRVSQGDEEEH